MSKKRRKNDNGNNHQPNHQQEYNITKINKEFKPKTPGQAEYVRAMTESDVTFCTGPAGSGKTACAVGLACEYLLRDRVKELVITRPIMETGSHGLGFLPGTMENKIHPYIIPILDEMYIYLGKYRTELLIESGKIRVVPLEVMRGRNFHQSFCILDEGQNATLSQLKMFLTRIGRESKVVITGDITQSDLYDDKIGLTICINKLYDVNGVAIVELTDVDIIRNSIISRILNKLNS